MLYKGLKNNKNLSNSVKKNSKDFNKKQEKKQKNTNQENFHLYQCLHYKLEKKN